MLWFKKILKELFPYTTKNWSIFFLCIIISSIFWLFLNFSGIFESELSIKIVFKDFPKNKILINEPQTEMNIKVKARGFDLLKNSWISKHETIILSSEDFKLIQDGSLFQYTLSSAKKKELIRAKLPINYEVLHFDLSPLELLFDDVSSKKVPLKPRYTIENDSNLYWISTPIFSHDSIEIKGSKSLLKQIHQLETEWTLIKQPKENQTVYLPVRRSKGVIEMSKDSIQIKIMVEPIRQYQMNVPVQCSDCPSNKQLKLFPSQALISFNCSEKEYKLIKANDFKLKVNFAEINPDSEKLFIHLKTSPKFARNIKITPAKAEFLLRIK